MANKHNRKTNNSKSVRTSLQTSSRKKLNKQSKRLLRISDELNLVNKNKSLKSKSIKVISFLIFVILIGALIIINKDNTIECTGEGKLASELIFIHIDRLNSVFEWQPVMENVLLETETETDDFLKRTLRPIQERIASIRTQTSQYEKMERIPGGPTSFIESSLQELRQIEENYLLQVDLNMFEKAKEKSKKIAELNEIILSYLTDAEECVENIKGYISSIVGELSSVPIGIPFILNITYMDNAIANDTITVQQLLQVLNSLAIKYQNMQDAYEKIVAFSKGEPDDVNKLSKVKKSKLIELQKILRSNVDVLKLEISENYSLYEYLYPLTLQSFKNVHLLRNKFIDHEGAKMSMDLRTMIQTDVQELKTRISSLRYTNAKATPKLRVHGFGLKGNILV